jgi:hypothetical protein
LEPEPEPKLFKRWNRNRNQNFSKVGTGTGTGTVKNSYGSTTLLCANEFFLLKTAKIEKNVTGMFITKKLT